MRNWKIRLPCEWTEENLIRKLLASTFQSWFKCFKTNDDGDDNNSDSLSTFTCFKYHREPEDFGLCNLLSCTSSLCQWNLKPNATELYCICWDYEFTVRRNWRTEIWTQWNNRYIQSIRCYNCALNYLKIAKHFPNFKHSVLIAFRSTLSHFKLKLKYCLGTAGILLHLPNTVAKFSMF